MLRVRLHNLLPAYFVLARSQMNFPSYLLLEIVSVVGSAKIRARKTPPRVEGGVPNSLATILEYVKGEPVGVENLRVMIM